MENPLPSDGTTLPSQASGERPSASPLERLASFRFTYIAFFVFLITYIFSVRALEMALDLYYRGALAEAVQVDADEGPVVAQVREAVDRVLRRSRWVRPGGVRADAIVLAADGQTLLYLSRGTLAFAPEISDDEPAERWVPVSFDLAVSIPHNALAANAILVAYAAFLLSLLFLYTRVMTRREEERLQGVVSARDALVARAHRIEDELGGVRSRLAQLEPARRSQATEIRSLQDERAELVTRLHALEEREQSLLADESEEVRGLREEHEALEDLLDEALGDVTKREDEIRELQRQLKQKGRSGASSGRESTQLSRRLRTLYKTLEIEDRVVTDLVRLGDEAMKLKAEEALKRLSDDADHTAVRRKVGGLPPYLSIFELGFGGRGRIYYTRGRARRHRVLLVGTKATQKPDLEYLSRLPRD